MKYLVTLSFLLLTQWLGAQTFTISGTITDEANTPLVGAGVVLQHPWGENITSASSGADGTFEIKNVGKGGYVLKISYLGYDDLKKQVTVSGQPIQVGVLKLHANDKVLTEVEIREKTPIAVQRGDTMELNAAAFKVMKDASAEELIEKMPTITNENGQIKAQGENVQQVLVDGKPFFGNDPTAAMKNLPAELIEKVQIYDAQSDQAQFTGFNDGNTVKTINIVTKTGMRNGQFGKVYAGYGYDDKYQLGGNISYFDGDRRISLIGMSNNINVQNFAMEDILGAVSGGRGGGNNMMRMGGGGFGGGRGGGGGGNRGGGGGGASDFLVNASGGIATTHAAGINYSDKWGKKVDVSGSYFFNKSNSVAEQDLYRQFLSGETLAEVYDETSVTHSDNLNHRFNLRLEYQIDSFNSLMFRPRLTLQQNVGDEYTLGSTVFGAELLNSTDNLYNSNLDGINFSGSLLYRHKFAKKGRTISLDVSNGYAPKRGESALRSVNGYFNRLPAVIDTLDQRGILDVNSWNVSGNLEYTEPLSDNAQLLLNYRSSYQQESSDRQTFDWSEATGAYDQLNIPLSNVFSNDYITHQAGAGYNYNLGRDLNFSARIGSQWASLANDQTFPQQAVLNKTFINILPSASLRYNIDKNRNIRFNYRSNTQLPSVEQLQNVVNNSNPLQLTAGNPNLEQAEQHNVFMRYQTANPEKSTMMFLMLGGGFTRNYVGNSTFFASSDNPIFQDLEVQPGAQLTLPVNLDGYYNARSFFTYGFPLKKIKCNLNADLSYNYSRTPGLVNDLLNYAQVHSLGAGLTLSSNISDKVDFAVSVRPTWNSTANTQSSFNNTEYLSQNARVKFNWQIIEGFVLRTDLTNNLFSGLSDDFNQNYWLWNLGIGKKVFKNERGEITLAVNDLLNQNRNIQRVVTESYIEDTRTNALTRFVMLSFTYNLRNFNTGKKSTNNGGPEGERRRDWGPPPGGF